PIDIRAENAHRLIRIVQPCPGCARGLVRDHDLVEGLIALPQRLPISTLIRTRMPDHKIGCDHAPRRETCLLLIRCDMGPAAAVQYAPNWRRNPWLGAERAGFSHIFTLPRSATKNAVPTPHRPSQGQSIARKTVSKGAKSIHCSHCGIARA